MIRIKKRKFKGPINPEKLKGKESENDSGIEESKSNLVRKRKVPSQDDTHNGVEKKPKKTMDYSKPPTAEEMKILKETEAQFHSNLFRMQQEECLQSVAKAQNKFNPLINKWLEDFNDQFLTKLKQMSKKWELNEEMTWLGDKIKVPYKPRHEIKGKFQFIPPKSKAFFIGSQSLETTIFGPESVQVDVGIEMPKEFFQTADYLNEIYHYKKSLYLCYLMKKIKKVDDLKIVKREFSCLEHNPLLPIAILTINIEGYARTVHVNIHLCTEESTYKFVRFIPERNNLRGSYFFEMSEEKAKDLNSAPTPHYNQSILRDLIMVKTNRYLIKAFENHKTLSEAVVLLKMWLRNRHLEKMFPSFLLNIALCHLIKTKRISPKEMSSYQIIRIFFSSFKVEDWTKGISLSDNSQEKCPTTEDFFKFDEIVFRDVTGFYNIFASLTSSNLKRLKSEAESALKILDNQFGNSFQSLFITQLSNALHFDHVAHMSITKQMQRAFLARIVSKEEQLNYCGNVKSLFINFVRKILEKGLDNRVKFLSFLEEDFKIWKLNQEAQSSPEDIKITIGISLNPEEAFEMVIKGPQANEPEAIEFREFWGEKSQLRRFKDGSITEACIFGTVSDIYTNKRLITKNIIKHLISHHLKPLFGEHNLNINDHLTYFANQLNCEIKNNSKRDKFPNGLDSELLSLDVITEFNELDHDLRFMENLPLEITTIHGTSSAFYYCDPVKNSPNGYYCTEFEKPVIYGDNLYEAVLQLSVSGKWPDDLEAIKHLKAAFYLEIAKSLKEKKKQYVKVNYDSLDVLKNGYVYRFKIAHHKELQLMKQVTVNGVICQRETEESLEFEKKMFIKPSLASALHGLHQQNNAFGPTVCLAKKWFNSLLFDNHLWPDDCTELLVASIFLKDSFSTPTQPQLGFLKFLHLLSETNWETEVVILNFNEMLSAEEVHEIESKFTINRTKFPPLTIITSFDNKKYSGIWSKEAPILQILVRACLLAKQLLKSLDEKIISNIPFDEKAVFQSNFAGFNATIKLNMENCKFQKSLISTPAKRLPVAFNPVTEFVRELREAYNDFALFFYNSLTPNAIGVLWKPAVKLPRDFRISDVNGRFLVKDKLTFNIGAILRDIQVIGHGLVEEIVT